MPNVLFVLLLFQLIYVQFLKMNKLITWKFILLVNNAVHEWFRMNAKCPFSITA